MRYASLARRLLTLITFVLYLTPGLTSSPVLATPTAFYDYDFESTLTPWSAASDPGTNISFARVTRSNQCPGSGSWSAELTITSTLSSPVGAWMLTSFTNTVTSTVAITWTAISAVQCAGCTPIAYVGDSAPTASSAFKDFTPTLTGSWQSYSHSNQVTNSTIYVAIGFLDTSTSDFYPRAVDIDCVQVEIR